MRESPDLDPLTRILSILQVGNFRVKRTSVSGAWALKFPKTTGVAFCLLVKGHCRLVLKGEKPQNLEEGDYLLLTAPSAWILRNNDDTDPVEFDRLDVDKPRRHLMTGVDGGEMASLVGGHFQVETAQAELLRTLLPPMLIIRSARDTAARLRRMLALLAEEAFSDLPGRMLVLEHLIEVMLVEAIRYHQTAAPERPSGLLAGLADPRIALTLNAIHSKADYRWTVQRLAFVAGMSRSAFAERFKRLTKTTPMEYLHQWRMALAKDMLRSRKNTLAEIASTVGYGSFSAFSHAFYRTVGSTPGRFAVQMSDAPTSDALYPLQA